MWTKFDYACMDTAYRWAELSHAKRKKVGAVFAKNNNDWVWWGLPLNMAISIILMK